MKDRRKLIVCVDMDDTVEQLTRAWVAHTNRMFGLDMTVEDWTSWELSEVFPGHSYDEIIEPLRRPGFWKGVEMVPEADIYLRRLMDDGHEIYFATAAEHVSWHAKVYDMFLKLFPFVNERNIMNIWNKSLLRCDVMVDDGPHNLLGDYLGIMPDMPHNRSSDIDKGPTSTVIRAHSWEEIYRIIDDYAAYLHARNSTQQHSRSYFDALQYMKEKRHGQG